MELDMEYEQSTDLIHVSRELKDQSQLEILKDLSALQINFILIDYLIQHSGRRRRYFFLASYFSSIGWLKWH